MSVTPSAALRAVCCALLGSLLVLLGACSNNVRARTATTAKPSAAASVPATVQKRPPIGEQLAELKGVGDYFRVLEALSGTTAVVGVPGRADVFTETAGGWTQVAALKVPNTAALVSPSVAISGTTIVAWSGGPTYVFSKTAGGWARTAELAPGGQAAISGTTILVDYSYIFTKTGAGWKQVAELTGPTPVGGFGFGYSVDISGTTAVIGDPGPGRLGLAYVFTKTGAGWTRVGELKGSDVPAGDYFGSSVAISGSTAVVGAAGNLNRNSHAAGLAYVFTKTVAGWTQVGELKGGRVAPRAGLFGDGDSFGNSVAVSGMIALVDAYVFQV